MNSTVPEDDTVNSPEPSYTEKHDGEGTFTPFGSRPTTLTSTVVGSAFKWRISWMPWLRSGSGVPLGIESGSVVKGDDTRQKMSAHCVGGSGGCWMEPPQAVLVDVRPVRTAAFAPSQIRENVLAPVPPRGLEKAFVPKAAAAEWVQHAHTLTLEARENGLSAVQGVKDAAQLSYEQAVEHYTAFIQVRRRCEMAQRGRSSTSVGVNGCRSSGWVAVVVPNRRRRCGFVLLPKLQGTTPNCNKHGGRWRSWSIA